MKSFHIRKCTFKLLLFCKNHKILSRQRSRLHFRTFKSNAAFSCAPLKKGKNNHVVTTTWKWLYRKSRSSWTGSFSPSREAGCSRCNPASQRPSLYSPASLWQMGQPSRAQRSPQTPYLLPDCWWRSHGNSNLPLFAAHRWWWWSGVQLQPQLCRYGSGPVETNGTKICYMCILKRNGPHLQLSKSLHSISMTVSSSTLLQTTRRLGFYNFVNICFIFALYSVYLCLETGCLLWFTTVHHSLCVLIRSCHAHVHCSWKY